MNTARDDEERPDDDDEAQILMELLMQQFGSMDSQIHEDRRGHEQRHQRFVAVVMPPLRGGERRERDREQQRHEGQSSDERKLSANHKLDSCCC